MIDIAYIITIGQWTVIQILTAFTRATMVKTTTPEVILEAIFFSLGAAEGKIERSWDHRGSHSFNHCSMSKNSQ